MTEYDRATRVRITVQPVMVHEIADRLRHAVGMSDVCKSEDAVRVTVATTLDGAAWGAIGVYDAVCGALGYEPGVSEVDYVDSMGGRGAISWE